MITDQTSLVLAYGEWLESSRDSYGFYCGVFFVFIDSLESL
jgi:hypothetical protein